MNSPKLILCDFDGVLTRFDSNSQKEGFYAPLRSSNPIVYEKIVHFLFSTDNYLGKSWMSGQITYTDVNALMAHKFGVERSYLDRVLLESLENFTLNRSLLSLLQVLRRLGTTVVIMSDNMDVFTRYVVPNLGLDQFFDAIFSSSDLQKMKSHNDWELPKAIAKKYDCDYADVLVIDDWEELITSLSPMGFCTFLYTEERHSDFEKYINELWL